MKLKIAFGLCCVALAAFVFTGTERTEPPKSRSTRRPKLTENVASAPLPPLLPESKNPPTKAVDPNDHEKHKRILAALGLPLHKKADAKLKLPRDGAGTAQLDWATLAATSIDRFPPEFPGALAEVDGGKIAVVGYSAPLADIGTVKEFLLLELPIGCFFCLAPPPNGIVRVEFAEEQHFEFTPQAIKIVGTLRLNRTAPEDFYFLLENAVASPID